MDRFFVIPVIIAVAGQELMASIPQDAINTLRSDNFDTLVLENCLIMCDDK
jgi:hypothetical protein